MRGLTPVNIGTTCSANKVGKLFPLFRKGGRITLTPMACRVGLVEQFFPSASKAGNTLSTLAALILCTLASLAHADQADHKFIDVQHDSVRGVTCWILNGRAISCLPDSSLPQNATPERQKNRASQTSFPSKNTVLDAGSLPQSERVWL